MPSKLGITLAGVLALIVTSAHADTFGSGTNIFTIDFVTIGDAGNPMDTGTTGLYSSPFGAVGYEFRMGTYEISEDMIDKANAVGGLFITKTTRSANQPATGVSWNEAARFVNWLNTSQGYSVAYKFAVNPGDAGYIAGANLVLWTPSDAGYDAGNLYRNSAAQYVLPSEDEWYKAAYYSGSGTTYYDYATGSDVIPDGIDFGGDTAFDAVFADPFNQGAPNAVTNVGLASPYGTFGQDGNVFEWDESAFTAPNDVSSEPRAFRGGNWIGTEGNLRSSVRGSLAPPNSLTVIGFRVASVPEPTASMLMIGSELMWLTRRRRESTL